MARFLSANAFSVYVFHPPVLIAAARCLSGVHLHPLVKLVLLTVIAAVASFLLSATVFRRTPGLSQSCRAHGGQQRMAVFPLV